MTDQSAGRILSAPPGEAPLTSVKLRHTSAFASDNPKKFKPLREKLR